MEEWKEKILENNRAKKYIAFDSPDFWSNLEKLMDLHVCNEIKENPYPDFKDFRKHEKEVLKNFKGTPEEKETELEKAKDLDEAEYQKAVEVYHQFGGDIYMLAKYKLSQGTSLNEKQFQVIWDKVYLDEETLTMIRYRFEEIENTYKSIRELEN